MPLTRAITAHFSSATMAELPATAVTSSTMSWAMASRTSAPTRFPATLLNSPPSSPLSLVRIPMLSSVPLQAPTSFLWSTRASSSACGISATTSAGTPATPPTPSLWLKLATILMVRFTALTCGLSGWMSSTAMLSSSSATPRSAKSTSTKTFCPLTWATPGTLASRQSAKLPRQLLMT